MSNRTDAIVRELEGLRDEKGMLHAPLAVKWARRHPRSALHAFLEWDNEVAGERHRIDQVRGFIQLHIVDALGSRRYVSLSIDRESGGGYRPKSEVLSHQDLRTVMLRDAIADLQRLQRLYVGLAELKPIWEVVEKL